MGVRGRGAPVPPQKFCLPSAPRLTMAQDAGGRADTLLRRRCQRFGGRRCDEVVVRDVRRPKFSICSVPIAGQRATIWSAHGSHLEADDVAIRISRVTSGMFHVKQRAFPHPSWPYVSCRWTGKFKSGEAALQPRCSACVGASLSREGSPPARARDSFGVDPELLRGGAPEIDPALRLVEPTPPRLPSIRFKRSCAAGSTTSMRPGRGECWLPVVPTRAHGESYRPDRPSDRAEVPPDDVTVRRGCRAAFHVKHGRSPPTLTLVTQRVSVQGLSGWRPHADVDAPV